MRHIDFTSVHNRHERDVIDAVIAAAPRYPSLDDGLLNDAACVALNQLRPHYVRHVEDLHFFLADERREQEALTVRAAVEAALQFVQSSRLRSPGIDGEPSKAE